MRPDLKDDLSMDWPEDTVTCVNCGARNFAGDERCHECRLTRRQAEIEARNHRAVESDE